MVKDIEHMAMGTLIKSTSGIRGIVGNGLDATIAENYARAFGTFVKKGRIHDTVSFF